MHASYKILSTCLSSCKMMYVMRTIHFDMAADVCKDFGALVQETCEALLGTSLSTTCWKQARLSSSAGGLDLRIAANHALAAYIASNCNT